MLINLKEGEYLGQTLQSFPADFFSLSITGYEPDCAIEKHYHDNNYISILLKGNYLEKNTFEKEFITPGDIIFRPGFYTHENLFENYGGVCFNIEFKPDWQSHFDKTLKLPCNFINYKTGSFPSLYCLLVTLQKPYNQHLAYEFICDWLFQINDKSPVKGPLPWIETVIKILENETESFHTLQSLSERIYVHPVYLARAFKEKKGITVGEYQRKSKLVHSLSLLMNTSLPISHISAQNGFFDDAHFIRSFKSVYKISPHQFRLNVKKLT